MRTLFASAVIVAAIALAPVAQAAGSSVTGTVKSVSATQLTLANGDIFLLPKGFKNPGLKAGEKIRVAYQKMGKSMEAESVSIIK